MRLLYLSGSGTLGGAERVLLDLMQGMRERGHEITLILGEAGPLQARASAAGVETQVLPMPRRLAAFGESGRSPISLLVGLAGAGMAAASYSRALADAVAESRPTVIHSNTLKTHVLAARLKPQAPVLWHLHDYVGSRPLTARLLRRLRGSARGAIANSASVAADARAVLPGFPIWTVPNAVALARFQQVVPAADLDERCGLTPAPPGTVRVGLIATYAWWKGHDVFLRALANLPHAPLRAYIVGGPIYQNGLRQLSADDLRSAIAGYGLAGRVGLSGFVEDTPSVLQGLDIVVHASTRPEPFGLVIAEAMAAGKAVIVSAAGGAAEIVESDHDALVYEPGNVMALTAHLQRLVDDGALRRRLGETAAQSARQRFDPSRFLNAIERAYGEALRASQ